MEKILIISHRVNGPIIAKKIAEDHPEIAVDFCGYEFSYSPIANLNHISTELEVSNITDMVSKLHTYYDFIIVLDWFFAFEPEFQKLKKSISTPILCLDRECAYLEYSKLSCKKMLNELKIPNPDYEIVEENQWGIIQDFKKEKFRNSNFILKMNSTCIGTGTQTRYTNYKNYKNTIHIYRSMNVAGPMFVEEKIKGDEISCHFLLNGNSWLYLGSARDYKKNFDGDQGENTASMGCYSPSLSATADVMKEIFSYMDKIVRYMNSHNIIYKGIMYLGIMIYEGIPNVLEINVRPGNPDFVSIVNNIKSKNFLENLYAACVGREFSQIEFNDGFSIVVNVIKEPKWKEGYFLRIDKYHSEYDINKDFFVIYHNEKVSPNYLFSISRKEKNLEDAAKKIYIELKNLKNYNFYYRKDIGILK